MLGKGADNNERHDAPLWTDIAGQPSGISPVFVLSFICLHVHEALLYNSDIDNCSLNVAGDRCNYTLVERYEISHFGEAIHVEGLGKIKCTAECIIRNKTCPLSKDFDIPEKGEHVNIK